MGWESVGRVRCPGPADVAVRVVVVVVDGPSVGSSSRWSEPSTAGRDAAEVLADGEALATLLGSVGPTARLRTAWSVAALALAVCRGRARRAVVHPDGMTRGLAFVRVRRRGGTRVAVLGDVLVPEGDEPRRGRWCGKSSRGSTRSGVAALGRRLPARDGFVADWSQGPLSSSRGAIATEPLTDPGAWDLGYGDLELL